VVAVEQQSEVTDVFGEYVCDRFVFESGLVYLQEWQSVGRRYDTEEFVEMLD